MREQCADAVGQLNFTTGAGFDGFEYLEDAPWQHITPDHTEGGGRNVRLGLFDDCADALRARVDGFAGAHDAIACGFGARHIFHAQYACVVLIRHIHHLLQGAETTVRGMHKVVCQQHRKRLITHNIFGAQHCMPQAQRLGLAGVDAGDVRRNDATHLIEQAVVLLACQLSLQLVGLVKMVFNRALGASRDEDHVRNTRFNCLFDRELDQRLVHDRQHFFRCRFRRGQEARA